MSGAEVAVTGVPPRVAERLGQLVAQAGGELTAADVLADAAAVTSALHNYFEWDDTTAARAYRMVQAALLIRRVRVTVIPADESEPVTVRAYVSRSEVGEAGGSSAGAYLPVQSVSGQTAREVAYAETMRRDLLRLRARYQNVEAFWPIAREVFALDSEAG